MADPFATVELMESRSQGEITATSHPYLARELEAATDAIREAVGWHIYPLRTGLKFERHSRLPVQAFIRAQGAVVTAATVNGREVDPLLVICSPVTGETNLYGRDLEIEYSAGLAVIPASLELLTLELAAAGLGTALGITREQAGAVALTYARTGTISADDEPRLATWALGYVP
jgi:hypothetical protein